MKILALEFASVRRSVAVVEDGQVRGRAEESSGRATHAFALIERALAEAEWEREAIEAIAVGQGPGSYTGIRLAISVAQGWQAARGVKTLGVSTVECLAAQAHDEGMRGRVALLIDAQRGEYYFTAFEVGAEGYRFVEPLRIVGQGEIPPLIHGAGLLIWPESQKSFPQGRVLLPAAGILGRIAPLRGAEVPGEKLEPIYLRPVSFVKAPPVRVVR